MTIKVYGDIILDHWIIGSCDRISPESPVPVLLEKEHVYSLGGAANLAANLHSLGVDVELTGRIGTDNEGDRVVAMLKAANIPHHLGKSKSPTTTKTRFTDSQGRHLLRWDREEISYDRNVAGGFRNNLKGEVVIVSDYNKGLVTKKDVLYFTEHGGCVLVDPKQSPDTYENAWLVKPNMKEYEQWFGRFNLEVAREKLELYGWAYLVVTDSANGIHMISSTDYIHFKEPVKEVADVTGAGDAVLAVIAYGVSSGMLVADAVKMACYAAARNVEQRGVSLVNTADLSNGNVFTNGCFDIIHEGHLKLLEYARSLGKNLTVGINSDDSIKRLKGKDRPINDIHSRVTQLKSLPWVNEVIVFDEDTPINLIRTLQPDLIVKGGDYTPEEVVGNDVAPVVIFPRVGDFSTTKIIERSK
jgi:D-beta-D-heptose 7-phosphate kinase/D-beta-D-heptose 1-phosphate adenosyltransferase